MIVFVAGEQIEIKEPSSATLKKYGLGVDEWRDIVVRQNYCCPICLRPLEKTTNIEHSHAKNWKKLPPDQRKSYVRGVTCWWCNKSFLSKGMTIEKAKNIVKYLEDYEKRMPK